MKNVEPLCQRASKSDKFDWCARIRKIGIEYLSDDPTERNTGWPHRLRIVGLLNIRNDFAIFLIHQSRYPQNFGLFYAPKTGTEFALGLWETQYGSGTPCWSDRLNSYKDDCWRFHTLEQDLFELQKLTGLSGWPTYVASNKKINW